MDRIVVVGAGIAAARTCASLRKLGYGGQLVLIGEEDRLPYDRPPLSKAGLEAMVDTTLPHNFGELSVKVQLGTRAQSLDLSRGVIQTDSGSVGFDGLVIATGAAPIRLPATGNQLTLRTASDADLLRERLTPRTRVVLIGASWIGAEVATIAHRRGCIVTCIEADGAPAASSLGAEVGRALTTWWQGIDLRLNSAVQVVTETGVVLADGTSIDADVVLTAVGARPTTAWLEGSGLAVDRGILVDDHLRTVLPEIVAVGDVAAWWSHRWGQYLRVLHWDDAAVAPATAAASLLGLDVEPYDPVPYFWSDQFGHKLQFAGYSGGSNRTVCRWSEDGTLQGAAWLTADGTLTAYLAIDRPRDMLLARRALADKRKPDPDVLSDANTPLSL